MDDTIIYLFSLTVFGLLAGNFLVCLWILMRIERMGLAKKRFDLWLPKYVGGIVLFLFATVFCMYVSKGTDGPVVIITLNSFVAGLAFGLGNFVHWKAVELGLDIGTGGLKGLIKLLNKNRLD